MSNQVVGLYVFGFFDSPNQSEWPSAQTWVNDIIASDFTHVILASFHVDTNGNLYGTVPVVTDGALAGGVNPALPSLYQQLAAAGKQVLYSIGNSSGSAGDLANLYTIMNDPTGTAYSTLQTNLAFVKGQFEMVGIDFDFEGPYGADQQSTIAQFTDFVDACGLLVTYCPYELEPFWVDAQNAATGPVSWWNLQTYGIGADPKTWADGVKGAKGVTDPAAFIVAGYSIDGGVTPSSVQNSVYQAAKELPGIGGAFIWQMGDIESSGTYTVNDYAQAIINGLAGQPGT